MQTVREKPEKYTIKYFSIRSNNIRGNLALKRFKKQNTSPYSNPLGSTF